MVACAVAVLGYAAQLCDVVGDVTWTLALPPEGARLNDELPQLSVPEVIVQLQPPVVEATDQVMPVLLKLG